ncbi:MAG TPA: sigma-54 dependent transcriptional regulator [Candidatus Binataceae bacterium]|nr:sigma-54 dependent transcriptional regulator [Candidatus Binataceae bacterium]
MPQRKPRIVVVDSEPTSSRQTVATLIGAGYECRSFPEGEAAIATLQDSGVDVVVADFASEKNTIELIRRVRAHSPQTAVILMASSPTVAAAVAAMRQGAFDYLTKPINTDELTAIVGKALELASLRRENRLLHEQLDVASMAAAFIAESAASRNLAAMVRRAAPANSPVLIEGESGSGKELVARMLHHWSSRAQGPFVKLSFKSLAPPDHATHSGIAAMLAELIERASGGTLFLDEISEASPELQSALLRLIGDTSSPKHYALAGGRISPAGVRLVASTNRTIAHEVASGRIRPDLYFALNVIAIAVAPLRARAEDILPLARHFLALHAAESGRALMLTVEAERALLAYSWPGNVRELENVIERAVVMSSSERISADALMLRVEAPASAPARIEPPMHSRTGVIPAAAEGLVQATEATAETASESAEQAETPAPAEQTEVPPEGTLQEFLDRAAAQRIRKAIESAKGNRNAAAAALGIDRTTLYRLARRLGI